MDSPYPRYLAKFQSIKNTRTRGFWTFISENLRRPLIFLIRRLGRECEKSQKCKMAEPSDNPCSSEDDEYSDPLEVAASYIPHTLVHVRETLYI